MYRRKEYNTLTQRLEEPRRFIQVLTGPRQTGKSTLVAQVLKSIGIPYLALNADTVGEADGGWISRSWESARVTMSLRKATEFILVIDEVQKIPNWSEYVKLEWDKDSIAGINLKVVLLGSSRLMLGKGLTESLAGRFELIRIGHWSYTEMRDAFGWDLDRWIYFGGYPGSASLVSDERRWRKYVRDALVAPSIEKDVVMTSRIYKPSLMRQLFDLGCSYSSEILSLTKLLGQLQDAGNVTTLQSYLNVLRQSNLLAALQKYANDDARKYQSIPKFQVFNNALLTVSHRTSFNDLRTDTNAWGRWVESAVGACLVGQAEESGYEVYYWRERNDEVDFIINRDGHLTAMEVKSGRRSSNEGLPLFAAKFHPDRVLVIGTNGISLEDFFSTNVENVIA